MGVSVEPGATMLQRTPLRAYSSPRHLVNMTAAAFEAAYAAMPVRGIPAAFEATVITLPAPRAAMPGTTERDVKKTPWTLTAKVAAQSSSVSSATGAARRTPATFTRMSIGPSSRPIRSTVRSTAAGSVTSSSYARTAPSPADGARPVSGSSSAASSATAFAWTSVAATVAPRRNSVRTTASPMPWPAPVTSATLPVNPLVPGMPGTRWSDMPPPS